MHIEKASSNCEEQACFDFFHHLLTSNKHRLPVAESDTQSLDQEYYRKRHTLVDELHLQEYDDVDNTTFERLKYRRQGSQLFQIHF